MALRLRAEVNTAFGQFPSATFLMTEQCTCRSLLAELKETGAKQKELSKPLIQFPFVVERSFHPSGTCPFFYMDNANQAMWSATHAVTKFLPDELATKINHYYVPILEFDLPKPVADLEELAQKLLTAHPVLTARYSRERKLVIRSRESNVHEYLSWDEDIKSMRHRILGLYERPLFNIMGHRARTWHKHGPAVRITVSWHHVVMDAYSEYLIERDVCALALGETLAEANLAGYKAIADNPIAKVEPETQHSVPTFSLRQRVSCSLMPMVEHVRHSAGMFVAVSYQPFKSDMERLTYFLDSWCECTGQLQGRFGLVTNARTKVDEDTSNLIGALLYNLEFTYDSTDGKLTPLQASMGDSQPGMVINMYPTPDTAADIVNRMAFPDPKRVISGDPEACLNDSLFSGAFGTDFADGKHLYVECLSTGNGTEGTFFLGIYPNKWFDGNEEIRALQRKLSRSQ